MRSMLELVLLRHGQSTYNELGLVQGCSDHSVLTDRGRDQARRSACLIEGEHFDALFVSPLARAQQTAALLRTRLPTLPAITTRVELRENDLVEWVGMPFRDLQRAEDKRYALWKSFPERLCMQRDTATGSVEFRPALEVRNRADALLAELSHGARGQRVLVVAHGGMNRALLSSALGLPVSHYHALAQSNCAVTRLRLTAQGWRLVTLNQTADDWGLPEIRERAEQLLLLATPRLAARLGAHFGSDEVHELAARSTSPWWQPLADASAGLHVWEVANADTLSALLSSVLGTGLNGALELHPDRYHAVQLGSGMTRPLALCINRMLPKATATSRLLEWTDTRRRPIAATPADHRSPAADGGSSTSAQDVAWL